MKLKMCTPECSKFSEKLNTGIYVMLGNLVSFLQFKKRKKDPWRSATFSKVAGWSSLTLLYGCFSRFLNCTNCTKSRSASHIVPKQLVQYFWVWPKFHATDLFTSGMMTVCAFLIRNLEQKNTEKGSFQQNSSRYLLAQNQQFE